MYVAPTISPQSLLAGGCGGCGSGMVTAGGTATGLPGGGGTTYVYTSQAPVSGGSPGGSGTATTLGSSQSDEAGDSAKELPLGTDAATGASGNVLKQVFTGSAEDWFLFAALLVVVFGIGLGGKKGRRRA